MNIQAINLPTVRIIDEWESELEDITIIYQIKLTSGDHQPDWYPVTCWQKGCPNYNIGGRFGAKPERTNVEKSFESTLKKHIALFKTE